MSWGTDVFATFTDDDLRLGLNAAQTTLGAIAQLAGAKVKQGRPKAGAAGQVRRG
jgi:hypothetical protein